MTIDYREIVNKYKSMFSDYAGHIPACMPNTIIVLHDKEGATMNYHYFYYDGNEWLRFVTDDGETERIYIVGVSNNYKKILDLSDKFAAHGYSVKHWEPMPNLSYREQLHKIYDEIDRCGTLVVIREGSAEIAWSVQHMMEYARRTGKNMKIVRSDEISTYKPV